MHFKETSLEQMLEVADFIASQNSTYPIVCFEGNLGAGKTTLIKLLASKMQLNDQVQSPTFGYVNTYDNKVHHFDCYRLNTIEEAFDLGFEEYFDQNKQIWIEWPQIILPMLPKPYLAVNIEHLPSGNRNILVHVIL